MLEKVVIVLCSIIVIVISGCMAWQEGLTPAYIDPTAIDYSGINPKVFMPYTSLWDARRIQRALDFTHIKNQTNIVRDLEDDKMQYTYLKDAMSINIASAEELRDTIFSPEGGLLSLLLAGSGIGIGALAISKPSDKKRLNELQNGNRSK